MNHSSPSSPRPGNSEGLLAKIPQRRLRVYAHRGACLRAPENTIEAFAAALADGATALEMDVHCTRDRHFVVSHDADGRRVAGWRHKIRDQVLEEVKSWRLSVDHGDGRLPAASVPTLDEVLQEFPGVPMSVDLKPARPDLVPRLLRVIANHGAEKRVTIASFHDRVVHRVRRLGYPGRTALTRLEVALLLLSPTLAPCRWIGGQAAQIPRRFAGISLDSERILSRCRALGLRADYWVVNNPEEARQLITRGATGVMTDDPACIAAALSGLA